MKTKNAIILFVLLFILGVIILFSFSLTGKIILSDYVSTAYAPPYNVFDNNASIFNLSSEYLSADNDLVTLSVNVSLKDGYIYQKGYVYNQQTKSWEVFRFLQSPVNNSYWIKGFASVDLIINASKTLQNGENYIVAYACKKRPDGRWQCGCQTSEQENTQNCTRWMIQLFNVSDVSIPATGCTSDADCTLTTGKCNLTTGQCVSDVQPPVVPEMEDTDGDGYLEIHDCYELQSMNNNLSANYELNNSIDCSETRNWNNMAGFDPIGQDGLSAFIGNFSGNNYTISNLFINSSSMSETFTVGLFGFTYKSEIKDVGLVNVSVKGYFNVGGLVGHQMLGSISNCYSTGNVTGYRFVGGLVAFSNLIYSSYSTADVTGWGNVGGFVGYSNEGAVFNSYSTGNVVGNYDVGGFIGNTLGVIITNSYSTGHVTGSTSTGGFLGSSYGYLEINNCYYDNETSGQSNSAGGLGLTTVQMKNKTIFENAGWDKNIWVISPSINNGYPYLKWQNISDLLDSSTVCTELPSSCVPY